MPDDEADLFKYISYVTLREGWTEIKGTFFAWLIISAIFIFFCAVVDFGVSETKEFWSLVPKPIWYVLCYAVFTWIARGEEYRIAFPRSFKLWLMSVVGLALIVIAALIFPTWAMMPVYFGVVLSFSVLDSLASIGKSNFIKLSRGGTDDYS